MSDNTQTVVDEAALRDAFDEAMPSFEEQAREYCTQHGIDADNMTSEEVLEVIREVMTRLETFLLTESLMKKNGFVYPTNPAEVRELIERDEQ